MNNIRGVLLDIDNTLYDYEPIHNKSLDVALDYLCTVSNKTYEEVKQYFDISRKEINKQHNTTASSHNRMLYFHHTCEKLDINPIEFALNAYNQYWDTFLTELSLSKEIIEFLTHLKKYKIAFVTDLTSHIQFRKMQKLNLEKYTDCVVTSEEIGVEKPASQMFETALQKLKLKNNEVIMVGDSFDRDVCGAVHCGITAVWLNKENKIKELPPNVYEIKNLSEVLEVLNDR